MKIAILAWGSLVPDPRGLPISGEWKVGGPQLAVEFSRVSKDARLTLVLDLVYGVSVGTRWTLSRRVHIGDAIADLRDREGTVLKHIGFLNMNDGRRSSEDFPGHADVFTEIEVWLTQHELDAAVWTALPANFECQTTKRFSVDAAIEYLLCLPCSARRNALRYIAEAPEEVQTPVRARVASDSRLRG